MSSDNEYEPFSEDEVEEEEEEAFDDMDEAADYYHTDEEDMDMIFTDSVVKSDKESKKDYEVDFKVLSMADIISTQDREIEQISGILGMHGSAVGVLLRHFRWNKDKLLEKYTENPQEILKSIGLTTNNTNRSMIVKKPGFFCNICCEESGPSEAVETFSMNCGHTFCKGCYDRFVTQKIAEEGECRNIRCLADCREILDDLAIKTIVSEDTFKK